MFSGGLGVVTRINLHRRKRLNDLQLERDLRVPRREFVLKGLPGLATPVGFITHEGYIQISYKDVVKYAHCLIWEICNGPIPEGCEVDHKDTVRHHNHIDNLRLATKSQNQFNRGKSKNNKSGYKGVSWTNQKQKWRAAIRIDNKSKHLGYFDSALEAALCYDKAAKLMHGEFYHEASHVAIPETH